jgi:hypothetical protein
MASNVGIRITAQDSTGGAFGTVGGKLSGLQKEATAVNDSIGGLVGSFNALGLAIGGAMSLASIKSAIDTADAFSKMAAKTGVAVEALRELNYAASLSDVSTEQLGTGLRKLSQNMALAAGGGKQQQETFIALGISVKDATGHLKGADSMLSEVAAKFANFKDSPEKAALAIELFGKAGAEMIPLLNSGATGLADMAQEARELGDVFGGDMAKQAEAFNDNLTRIQTVSQSVAISLATELLPTLVMLSDEFLNAQKSSTGFGSSIGGGLKTVLEAATVLFGDVSFVLKGVGREIGAIGAQMAALARGDFSGFRAISEAVKEDGVRARAELDKFQFDLLNAGILTSKAGAGRGTATDPRLLGDTQATAPVVAHAAAVASAKKTISEAAKGLALYNDLLDASAGFDKRWAEDTNKLRAALDGRVISQTQYNEAITALLAKQPLMVAAAKAEADWQKDVETAATSAYEARAKAADSLSDELNKQLEHNDAIGLSVIALADLEAAKLRDLALNKDSLASTADLIDFSGQMGDQYRAQAKALRELASAKVSGAIKQTNYDAAKDMAAEQKKAAEESGKYWEDALMRAFESGKGFFESLWSTIKNTLKTQVLKVTIQGVMGTLGIGAAGAASAGGGGITGLAGTASTISNLYSGVSSLVTVGSQVVAGTMSAVNALGTIAANATGTGITGLLATNGAYGTAAAGTASATAGGFMSGATAALAAIPVWGWVALGVAAIAAYASGRGETRSGATYTTGSDGKARYSEGPSGGEIAGDAARALFDSTKNSIQDTLKLVGSQATVTGFVAGLESSKNGKGFAFAGGLVDGAAFGENLGRSGGQFGFSDMNNEQAMAAYVKELKQATLQALQAATDIPKLLSDQLAGIDIAALDTAGLDNLVAAVGGTISAVNGFVAQINTGGIKELHDVGFAAAAGLIAASGGLENLTANLNSYYTNFYSAEEQRLQTIKTINAATAGSGLDAATATRESFRAIVEAQDLTTESGRGMYAALLGTAAAFAGITPALESINPALVAVATGITDTLRKLRSESEALGIDLLRAQGNTAGADAAQYQIDTTGLSDAEKAVFDYNAGIRAQITALNDQSDAALVAAEALAQLTATNKGLADQLDMLTGAQTERSIALRDAGDDSTRYLMAQVYAWQDLKTSTEAAANAAATAAQALAQLTTVNKGWADQLDVLTGAQTDRSIALRDAGDDSTRALMAQVYAQQDLKTSTEAAAAAAATLKSAFDSLESARVSVAKAYDNIAGKAASTAAGVVSAQDGITQGYLSAQNAVAAAQQNIADITRQAAVEMRGFADSIKDFLLQMATTDIGANSQADQLAAAQADFAVTAAQARAGDKTALGSITGKASTLLSAGKDQFSTAVDFARFTAGVGNTLADLATLADGKAGPLAEAVDPMVKAQADLLKANQDLSKWGEAASKSGASTARTVDDYLKDWRTATAADAIAQADLKAAQLLTSEVDLKTLDVLGELKELIAGYNAAKTAVVAAGGVGAAGGVVTGVNTSTGTNPNGYTARPDGTVDTSTASAAYQQGIYSTLLGYYADAGGAITADVKKMYWESAGLSGLPTFAVGTNYVPQDMLAQIHEGEAIIPKAYNPAANSQSRDEAVVLEIRALREEVIGLRAEAQATSGHTSKTARLLDRAMPGGDAIATRAAV